MMNSTPPRTSLFLGRNPGAVVPAIWFYEVRNILVINERRGRISNTDSERFLEELAKLRIELRPIEDERNLVGLARQFRLTVYDAAYLELAIRERLPLATLDKALRAAVVTAGVPLLA